MGQTAPSGSAWKAIGRLATEAYHSAPRHRPSRRDRLCPATNYAAATRDCNRLGGNVRQGLIRHSAECKSPSAPAGASARLRDETHVAA